MTNHVYFQPNRNFDSKIYIDNSLHLKIKLNKMFSYNNMKHDLCLE